MYSSLKTSQKEIYDKCVEEFSNQLLSHIETHSDSLTETGKILFLRECTEAINSNETSIDYQLRMKKGNPVISEKDLSFLHNLHDILSLRSINISSEPFKSLFDRELIFSQTDSDNPAIYNEFIDQSAESLVTKIKDLSPSPTINPAEVLFMSNDNSTQSTVSSRF
jgi:outer membrane lipopolysaccharide assembly protein LptE/RlpB